MHVPTKVRARHGSWESRIKPDPIFKNVVTLDPAETVQVWDKLSVNTTAIEFRELPLRLHKSFVRALKQSLKDAH
ncbi:hypothetical protein SAMN05444415_10833 [Salipiger profundus]|nr:hypothetical protein SAMN05444415_10833 [Salipiger profundus]